MTKNSQMKKKLYTHQIWQLIYSSRRETQKLFPTVAALKFFFPAFGRKQIMKMLPSILETVSILPLQNKLILLIKEIDEKNYEEIKRFFESYGLLNYMEMCGLELLKN